MTKLHLHNVTQAYVQSTLDLNQDFFTYCLAELFTIMWASFKCISKVLKPFYDVLEAGNYWFATYNNHHINIFTMSESTYDYCLLQRCEPFGIFWLQMNNTLIFANNTFADIEKKAIKIAKLRTKEQVCLSSQTPIKFNGIWI